MPQTALLFYLTIYLFNLYYLCYHCNKLGRGSTSGKAFQRIIKVEPLLKELTGFGLTTYEAKCYTVLIRKREMTAVEISKIGGVPRSRIYEVLENLLLKGLCSSVPGPVVKYRGVAPEALKGRYEHNLEKIKKDIETSQNRLTKAIETRDKTVAALTRIFSQGQEYGATDSMDYIEVIRNPLQIYKKYEELFDETKEKVLSLTKERPILFTEKEQEVSDEQKDIGIKALKRGVKIKCIYELPPDNEDSNKMMLEYMSHFIKAGEKVKIIDELPLKMFVFDSKISIFTMDGPDFGTPTSTLQIVKHKAVAKALTLLFESLWEKAMDYETYINRKI